MHVGDQRLLNRMEHGLIETFAAHSDLLTRYVGGVRQFDGHDLARHSVGLRRVPPYIPLSTEHYLAIDRCGFQARKIVGD
jgi:hypothetical protein